MDNSTDSMKIENQKIEDQKGQQKVEEVKVQATGNPKTKLRNATIVEEEKPSDTLEPREPIEISVKNLLEAGAHFGHQTERWNPKMLPYIYAARNNVHIINLDVTMNLWTRAQKFITDKISQGGNILFVGTKQQARDLIKDEARRCGAFFVNSRWLGGTLTNFQTIKNSITHMRRMEDYIKKADDEKSEVKLNKKERLETSREVEKLEANLGGIRDMKRPPDLVFVVDVVKESIAVAEANRLHIPVIALVDTNTDPTPIQFPIPSNDDSSRTLSLFIGAVSDAVSEGRAQYQARLQKEAEQSKKDKEVVKKEPRKAASKEATESDQSTKVASV